MDQSLLKTLLDFSSLIRLGKEFPGANIGKESWKRINFNWPQYTETRFPLNHNGLLMIQNQ